MYNVDFDPGTGGFVLVSLMYEGTPVELTHEDKKAIEDDLNMIREEVEDGISVGLAQVGQARSFDGNPFSMHVVIGEEDDNRRAQYVIYVINDRMRVSEMAKNRALLATHYTDGHSLQMFHEPGIAFFEDFDQISHAEGKGYSNQEDPEKVGKFMDKLRGISLGVDGTGSDDQMPAELAETLRIAVYGDEKDSLRTAPFLGAILLKESKDGNTDNLSRTATLFSDHLDFRKKLLLAESDDKLKEAFVLANMVSKKMNPSVEVCPLEAVSVIEAAPGDLRQDILRNLLAYVSSFGHSGLSDVAGSEVKGWSEFVTRLNKSPVDPDVQKALHGAILMRAEGSTALGYYGMFVRKHYHGLSVKSPLDTNLPAALKMYFKMESFIGNVKDKNVFYNIVTRILYNDTVEDLSLIGYEDLIRMLNDVTFDEQWNRPRWVEGDWGALVRPVEREALNEASNFMVLYAIIWIIFMYKRRQTQAGTEWYENYTAGMQMAILVLGWATERMDLFIVHVLLTVGWNIAEVLGKGAGSAQRRLLRRATEQPGEDPPVGDPPVEDPPGEDPPVEDPPGAPVYDPVAHARDEQGIARLLEVNRRNRGGRELRGLLSSGSVTRSARTRGAN